VIFVCENNLYAMGTRQSRVMNIENVADRAVAYGICGVVADGNNVMAVYQAGSEAVQRARRGEGPTLIECKTYRHKGHSRVDPAKYRPKDEVQEWLRRDPVKNFKEYLARERSFTETELQSIEKEAAAKVDDAVKFALESPYPAPEDALDDVYA
jgi:pyruvate dehydrogenase E1 component alpha subunit